MPWSPGCADQPVSDEVIMRIGIRRPNTPNDVEISFRGRTGEGVASFSGRVTSHAAFCFPALRVTNPSLPEGPLTWPAETRPTALRWSTWTRFRGGDQLRPAPLAHEVLICCTGIPPITALIRHEILWSTALLRPGSLFVLDNVSHRFLRWRTNR